MIVAPQDFEKFVKAAQDGATQCYYNRDAEALRSYIRRLVTSLLPPYNQTPPREDSNSQKAT